MTMAVPAKDRVQPDSLEDRYAQVVERVAQAARRAGRPASDVLLVAVTKNAHSDQIRKLVEMGHRDLGENRVQALLQHQAIVEEYLTRLRVHSTASRVRRHDADALFSPRSRVDLAPIKGADDGAGPVRWHMIGHLQRNKAKKIVDLVRLVHSVDSLRLAEELQGIALRRDQTVEVLIEVNCSGEASKQGCPVPAAIPLAEQIETMVNVKVRGLMTMAPYSTNPEDARGTFARCRELFEEMRTRCFADGKFNILSMGMSGDFEVAISEGANIVRVGSAIFGQPLGVEPGLDEDEDD
jgi:pyridoxal phosphate enzyme (YggS family)